MPLKNLLVIFLSALISLVCYDKADRSRYVANLVEAMHIIDSEYLYEIEPRQVFENAMKGMAKGLDPHSDYISPQDYEMFMEGLDQEIGGIGILIELNPETKRLTVLSVLLDTPAYKAGLQAGDVVLEINGKDTNELGMQDSAKNMRGEPGTEVELLVQQAAAEEPVPLKITRAVIPIESVLGERRTADGHWHFEVEDHPRITYVRLTTFGEKTFEELQRVLEQRQPVEALILDLRDNSGGLLNTAVEICDLFIDAGAIVSTRSRGGVIRHEYLADEDMVFGRDVPIVVLTNQYSASASEIVAACLQDHGRAKIVGQRTWGKGTVQNVITMEGGASALKLTTASYWRPSEKNIHRREGAKDEEEWGVRPDPGFEVVLDEDQERASRRAYLLRDEILGARERKEPPKDEGAEPPRDPQLEKAVEFLQQQLAAAQPSAAAKL